MTRNDVYWCLAGLVIGLLIAMSTLRGKGFVMDPFHLGQLTGNVIGGVLLMFVIGKIVQRFSKKG